MNACHNLSLFTIGFLGTIKLFVVSAIGSLIGGTLLASMRVSPGTGAARSGHRIRQHRAQTPH